MCPHYPGIKITINNVSVAIMPVHFHLSLSLPRHLFPNVIAALCIRTFAADGPVITFTTVSQQTFLFTVLSALSILALG